jgi:DNA (cytosine-5)-methyltransferase 1
LAYSRSESLVEENAYYWKEDPVVFLPTERPDLSKPLAVDLFCGMGGLSLGFQMAGFECVLGLDIHKPSVETFRGIHPRAAVILGDIRKVVEPGVEIKENLITSTLKQLIGDRKIDVLMAGIPCQGFSLANKKRSAADERNYLFMHYIQVVKHLKPTYVVIENVEGLKGMSNGSFVRAIKWMLGKEGYEVEDRLLCAADFGVPQLRKRIVFIGAKHGYPIVWPTGTFGTPSKPYRTVWDAISDLPPLKAGESAQSYCTLSGRELTEYQRLMRGNASILHNHQAPKHPQSVVEKIAKTKPGEPMYERYPQRIRLSWDKPSPTQVAGGIRPQFQFGHPEQARGLTVRERCRIQSIPDWVVVHGGIVQGRVQTGNAVPPLLAKAVGEMIYLGLHARQFQELLLAWGRENKRDLPWRAANSTLYQVLVSEMLLRKTKAEAAAPVYSKLISRYPNPIALAEASVADMEELIKPIGLSRIRATALKKLGQTLVERYNGEVPTNPNALRSIDHIGRYAANAALLFANNERQPIVDENVQRVLNRVFEVPKSVEIHKADYLWEICEVLMPLNNPREFGWALLDFAAAICCPKEPKCKMCPLKDFCKFKKRSAECVQGMVQHRDVC